jgi:hypothetical protein
LIRLPTTSIKASSSPATCENRLRVIALDARLSALHIGLFALHIHDLDDGLFDMFKPFLMRHATRS